MPTSLLKVENAQAFGYPKSNFDPNFMVENMSFSSVIRAFFVLLISVLLSISALADTLPVPQNGFTFQRLESRDVVRNPQPRGRAVLGKNLFGVRGVLLQSSAIFIDDGVQIPISDVELEWVKQGENTVVCLRYQSSCTTISLDDEVIFRAAYWVATSQSTVAFTLLPQEELFDESRVDLFKAGYRAPTSGFSFVGIDFFGEPETVTATSSTLRDIVTHPALDHSGVLSALAYVDFVDSNQIAPSTDQALALFENSEDLVLALNSGEDANFVKTVYQSEDVLDGSFTNADVDSKFVVDLAKGQLSGQPLRYFWDRVSGLDTPHFRSIYRFHSSSEMSSDAEVILRDAHRDAMLFTQLVATLRAFQFEQPEELAHFVNQGLDARTRN